VTGLLLCGDASVDYGTAQTNGEWNTHTSMLRRRSDNGDEQSRAGHRSVRGAGAQTACAILIGIHSVAAATGEGASLGSMMNEQTRPGSALGAGRALSLGERAHSVW